MSRRYWSSGRNTDSSMNRTTSALLALLRAGLWNKRVDNPGLFPLSVEEWEGVYVEARRQTVTGWVYQGICSLPDEWMPSRKQLFRWTVEIDRIEQRNRRMNRSLLQLTTLLEEKGFRPVVLKGQGIAALYDEPMWRECGDIDLYFPQPEDRIKAETWLTEQGYAPERKPDGSTLYAWQGTEVEHHAHLFDLQSPKVQGYLKGLIAEKGFVRMDLGGGNEISVPSPVMNFLLLNTHILKHALGKGIGLRQLCDMARAYAVWGKQVDGEEMKRIYRNTGIGKWSCLLHAFLTEVLGMPAEYLPYPEKKESAAPLLDIVLRGGNFGQHGKGANGQDEPTWRRKWNTCRAFWQNMGFSLKYAPGEAIHTFGQLVKGQFK